MSPSEARLRALLAERILVLEGPKGTMIQARRPLGGRLPRRALRAAPARPARRQRGADPHAPRRDRVDPRRYLDAGTDITETGTFGATRIAQADYGLEAHAYEMNLEGARICRRLADAWTARTPDKPRFVAGAIGPTTRTLSISPDVNDPGKRALTWAELTDAFAEQMRGLLDGGVDLLLVETQIDTLNTKAALVAIDQVARRARRARARGGLGGGHRRERAHALGPDARRVLALGAAREPARRRPQLLARRRADAAPRRGAGRDRRHLRLRLPERRAPERDGRVRREPRAHRQLDRRVGRSGLVNLVGGCCGTTPEHIGAIATRGRGRRAAAPCPTEPTLHPPRRPRDAHDPAGHQLPR